MHLLEDILKPQIKDRELSLDTLRHMNQERKAKHQKISKRSVINKYAKDYTKIVTNIFEKPKECSDKLTCLNNGNNSHFCDGIKCF